MRYKVEAWLSSDGIPIDGDIHIYVDDNYITTISTVDGYAQTIIDVTGKYLTAKFLGTEDYEPCQVTVALPTIKLITLPTIPAWITYDILYKEVKKRIPKVVKYMYADKQGFERLRLTIQAQINLFSMFRTSKYVNLLEVVEYSR